MNLTQSSLWRKWTGRTGTLLCLLLFLAILDALVARFREPINHFSGLPGSRIAVSGPLADRIADPRELTYQANSKEIELVFEAVQTGYWFGGYMWNGTLMVGTRIQPGGYELTVYPKKGSPKGSPSRFEIEIFKDLASLQHQSKSFIERSLEINPWIVVLFLIPFILLTFGIVFYLSHRAEIFLAEQGKAEVYRITKGETGYQIFFGLGRNQGIQPGDRLTVIDNQGRGVGSIIAQEVFAGHSTAQLESGLNVSPGFIISQS
ncbi:MAG: hypothetical protein C0407_03550 [Desulfobacca sp.]|nr:hypothetical protein [Desulfobacca sp.]